jgi:hypothetical protein
MPTFVERPREVEARFVDGYWMVNEGGREVPMSDSVFKLTYRPANQDAVVYMDKVKYAKPSGHFIPDDSDTCLASG